MRKSNDLGSILAAIAMTAMAFVTCSSSAANALPILRVAKGFPGIFDFTPLDIGLDHGFFKQHGLDIQASTFVGASKLQQALAANATDVGLDAGTSLAFVARGAPDKGIAAFMGPPVNLVLFARKEPSIRTIADLKGKRISVSTVGSLTFWLAHRFAENEGWGAKGVRVTPLGSTHAQIAALRLGQTDGMVISLVGGTVLQQKGYGRIMMSFGHIIPHFITHVVDARDSVIKDHPEELRRFLAAWFETIVYMKHHKAETVRIAAKVMHEPPSIVAKTYDLTMPAFSTTGRFEPAAVAELARSFVQMGLLKKEPDMHELYTEKFLPHPRS